MRDEISCKTARCKIKAMSLAPIKFVRDGSLAEPLTEAIS